MVLDIDGYFILGPAPSALAFYPLKPCRVTDTRWPTGALGWPLPAAGTSRELPVRNALSCNIPADALAYSSTSRRYREARCALGVEHLASGGIATHWSSTLNAPTGTTTANAAIVPAGNNGDIDVWVSDATDLVIDINGYFAPSGTGGLSLYSMASLPRHSILAKTVGIFSGLLLTNVNGQSHVAFFGRQGVRAECHRRSSRAIMDFNAVAGWPAELWLRP